MIITMRPVPMTVAAGTDTCASTFATATAVPARRPVAAAISSVRPPARAPSGRISSFIFSLTMLRMRGCSAAKKSGLGKPSSLLQIALYPAVQLLRVSTPVSCQTIQSAASINRSAAS